MLLKNDDNVLPLAGGGQRIAVIGPGAGPQGAEQFYNGDGSGHVPELGGKPEVVSPLQGIQQRASAAGDTVLYADGTQRDRGRRDGQARRRRRRVRGRPGQRGRRPHRRSTSARATARWPAARPSRSTRTQLISAGGGGQSAHDRRPQHRRPGADAVAGSDPGPVRGLVSRPGGRQRDRRAAVRGRQSVGASCPRRSRGPQADIPTPSPQQYPGVTDAQGVPQSHYSEGLLVGYRWYDAKHIAPLFPFGYRAVLHELQLQRTDDHGVRAAAPWPRRRVAVTNTGQRAGADIPQLYIAAPAATGEPPKQLKGFQRIDLPPGQTGQVSFPIDARALSYWSTALPAWQVAPAVTRSWSATTSETSLTRPPSRSTEPTAPERSASIRSNGAPPRCSAPQGRLSGSRLGPVALGMTRARIRRTLTGRAQRGLRDMDFFCLVGGGGIRAGFPSARLLARCDPSRPRRQRPGGASADGQSPLRPERSSPGSVRRGRRDRT